MVITNHEEAAEANEESERRKGSLEPFHNLKVGRKGRQSHLKCQVQNCIRGSYNIAFFCIWKLTPQIRLPLHILPDFLHPLSMLHIICDIVMRVCAQE